MFVGPGTTNCKSTINICCYIPAVTINQIKSLGHKLQTGSTKKLLKMKRYFYILTISTLLLMILSCQSVYQAQKQMDKYNYSKAIVILKKVIADKKMHNTALAMLAECYRLQDDILNSLSTYEEVVKLPDAKPESFYYYAQALRSTGDYAKAREMFQKYAALNPADPRGKLYASHCDSVIGPWKERTSPFEIKIANNINTKESDFGPVIYDGALVFASDHNTNPGEGKEYGWTGRGYLNIMKSGPESAGDFWDNMGAVSEFSKKINQEYHDGPATFSADGSSIYFTRSYFGKAKRQGAYKTNLLKIFYTNKTNGDWGEVMPFFLNSKDYSVGHPTLSADGQTLYFVSDMPGGLGNTDIWMCKRTEDSWGPPINLGKNVNTSEKEMFPTIVDNDVLYFASDGHPGYGALDIFKTKNENGTWTTPENLYPPINSSFDDFAIAFVPGEKNGFFSSNQPLGVGSDDIYAFRFIEPKPMLLATISGYVKEKSTLQPMPGATVFLYNPFTDSVKVLKTDFTGMYKTTIKNPGDYIVKGMMSNYISDCTPFSVAEFKPDSTNTSPRDLLLDKLTIGNSFKIDNIYYDFDKYTIRNDAKPELDKLVRIMKENPINVELSSHTDSRGSAAYNYKLSEKRAKSAVEYIVNSGTDRNRIKAKGYGESQLINKCSDGVACTPEEHQANRRTEFKVMNEVNVKSFPEIDLTKFIGEEIIPFKDFDTTFFNKCEGIQRMFNQNEDPNKTPATLASRNKRMPTVLVPDNEGDRDEHTNYAFSQPNTYRVQLGAFSVRKKLTDPEFKGLNNIQECYENGLYKYTSGEFDRQEECMKYRERMVLDGFKDAYMVNSVKVYISEQMFCIK